jgi:hypothetical protein
MASEMAGAIGKSGSAAVSGITPSGIFAHLRLKALCLSMLYSIVLSEKDGINVVDLVHKRKEPNLTLRCIDFNYSTKHMVLSMQALIYLFEYNLEFGNKYPFRIF